MMALLFLAIPAFFFLVAWTVAAVFRLCFPERPVPILSDAAARKKKTVQAGESVPVGFQEIREDQRRYQNSQAALCYHYEGGESIGLPPRWLQDLWDRRN